MNLSVPRMIENDILNKKVVLYYGKVVKFYIFTWFNVFFHETWYCGIGTNDGRQGLFLANYFGKFCQNLPKNFQNLPKLAQVYQNLPKFTKLVFGKFWKIW